MPADTHKPVISSPEAVPPADLPTRAVCRYCGSEDVCRDASARWDGTANAWSLAGVYDECTCQTCGADGDDILDYRPIVAEAARIEIASQSAEHPRPMELIDPVAHKSRA